MGDVNMDDAAFGLAEVQGWMHLDGAPVANLNLTDLNAAIDAGLVTPYKGKGLKGKDRTWVEPTKEGKALLRTRMFLLRSE